MERPEFNRAIIDQILEAFSKQCNHFVIKRTLVGGRLSEARINKLCSELCLFIDQMPLAKLSVLIKSLGKIKDICLNVNDLQNAAVLSRLVDYATVQWRQKSGEAMFRNDFDGQVAVRSKSPSLVWNI